MLRNKILLLISLFTCNVTSLLAQSSDTLDADRDSICAIVYSQLYSLQTIMNSLVETKGDPDLCHSLLHPVMDTASGIFYPGKTLIQDDISNKSSSGIARNLSVNEYFENFINDLEKSGIISIHFNNLRVGKPSKGLEFNFINVVGIREYKFKGSTLSLERKITFIIDDERKLKPIFIATISNYDPASDSLKSEYIDLKEASNRYAKKYFGSEYDKMTEEKRNSVFQEKLKEKLQAAIDAENYQRVRNQIDNQINMLLLEVDELIEKKDWKNCEAKLNEAKNLDSDNLLVKAKNLLFLGIKPTFEKEKKKGDEYFTQRKLAEARESYKNAIEYKSETDDISAVSKRISEIDEILNNIENVQLKIDQGRVDIAKKDLEGYILANSDVPEYYLWLGDCHMKKGKYDDASLNYNIALKLNSKEAYRRLARMYNALALNNKYSDDSYYKAIQNYSLYLKSIESAEARDELSATYYNLYLYNKKTQSLHLAILESNNAVALSPDNRNYIFRLGQLYYTAEIYDSSNYVFTKTLNIEGNKDDVLSYFNRGLTFIKLKNFDKAGADFERARMLGIPSTESILLAAITDSLATFARSFYDKQLFSDAEINYTKVIAISKDPYDAYFYRGNSRYLLNKFPVAISDFTESAKLLAYKADSEIMIAKCEFGLKKYEKSFAVLKPYVDKPLLNPIKQKEIYNYAGKAKYNLKAYPDASKCFDLSLQIDKEQHDIYYLWGLCLYRLNNFKIAIEKLSSAIRINEITPEYYFYRGCSYYKLNQWKNTIEDFNKFKIINKEPVSANDEYILESKYLGYAHMELEQHEESINAFTRYLVIKISDPEIYLKRGVEYKNNRNYPAAVSDFQNAIKYDSLPGYAYEAWLNLGEINLELKSFNGAQSDFTRAKENYKGSGCDLSQWGLARVYFAQKDVPQGAKALETYVRLCKPEMKDVEKNEYVKPYRKDGLVLPILEN